MKPIRLSGNTKEQLFYRGITEEEVIETISSSTWKPAEPGRLEAREDFVYEKDWNKTKQVKPILFGCSGKVRVPNYQKQG